MYGTVEALGVCKWFTPRHSWKLRSRPMHEILDCWVSQHGRVAEVRVAGRAPREEAPGLVVVFTTGAAGCPCAEA